MAVETAVGYKPAVAPTKTTSLKERLLHAAENFLTPDFNWNKLAEVDVIVVHGGSGARGVATAMILQDQVAARRGDNGAGEDDLRPPLFFTGRWSVNTPEDQRPKLHNGQTTTQAAYMREKAIRWGVPAKLIAGIEERSETTKAGIKETLTALEESGMPHKTILFVSAHMFPRRNLLIWQHYAPDLNFLPLGSFAIQKDEQTSPLPKEVLQQIRRKDAVREVVKNFATAALFKLGIW